MQDLDGGARSHGWIARETAMEWPAKDERGVRLSAEGSSMHAEGSIYRTRSPPSENGTRFAPLSTHAHLNDALNEDVELGKTSKVQ